jgi:tetratricopeptide (TPR) repeat protein/tRNA A-37 threonylcarbamoyl transferase component Bud32
MTCPGIVELEQYLSGELDGGSREVIGGHVSTCAECESRLTEVRENLAGVGSVREALRRSRSEDTPTPTPARIGRYEVTRTLGRGGMGIVYEARQADTDRRVALKVLHLPFLADEHYVRAFRREAQALGRLNHPGIASIFEAGQTDDGRPYFSMELVGGSRLLAYVQENDLSLRERVALFRDVCEAVSYAHQRGVIHRDLKPSNILVADTKSTAGSERFEAEHASGSRIKVLDFGLARLMEADGSGGADSQLTGAGRVFGTIPYMSPEQVRGGSRDLDVRSDVYSLGVVLYEMLTGRLPYDIDPYNLPQAARAISEERPRFLRLADPALRGDLETIVLKALQKLPHARYASASAFADDLSRFLRQEAIAARAPTAAYQLSKLIRRHKVPAALGAALVVSVLTFGVIAGVLAVRLAHERAEAVASRNMAENRRAEAEAVNTFLIEMLASADPQVSASSPDVTLREVLDRAASKVEETTVTEFPHVRVALQTTIGNAYRAISRFEDAEKHLRAAVETGGRLTGADGRAAYSQSLNKLARLLEERAEFEEAERCFREALAIRRELYGDEHADVAIILDNLGTLLHFVGRNGEAERLLREALAIRRSVLDAEHSQIASSLNNLAMVLSATGRVVEADRLYSESLAMDRKLRSGDHPNIASTMSNLGIARANRGRYAEAEELQREALAMWKRLVGTEHSAVARTMNNLAFVLRPQGKLDEAEALYRQSIEIERRIRGEKSIRLAGVMDNLGLVLLDQGTIEEAERTHRHAYEIRLESFGAAHVDTLLSLFHIAGVIMQLNRHPEAAGLLTTALQGMRQAEQPADRHTALILERYGECLISLGRFEDATAALEESSGLFGRIFGSTHPRSVRTRELLDQAITGRDRSAAP